MRPASACIRSARWGAISLVRSALPADVDLAEFPVVDVSAEPYDGNPGHSAVSVTRGTLSV